MRAGTLSAALAVILAGHLYAAERPTDLLLEYTERLLALEDTAQAHVELAKWCEANGLPDRATIHWQEALSHDPDNEEARRALGIGRQETRETQEAGPVLKAAPALLEKQRALATEIRDILRRFLLPTDAEAWAEGRRRILRLSDPAGVTPLTRILGEGTVAERRLAAEALGGIPGDEAREAIVRMLLTDRSKDVYLAALRSLKSRADSARVGPLVQALGGSKGARRRAAYALGKLNAWHAIGALIGHLKAPEPRVVKPTRDTSGRGAYIAIGTITTYVRDAELVVSNGAVAWNPVIGAIMSGAVLSVSNARVTARRTIIRVLAPQPVVLEALKRITGQDFGYEQDKWRIWLRRLKREERILIE